MNDTGPNGDERNIGDKKQDIAKAVEPVSLKDRDVFDLSRMSIRDVAAELARRSHPAPAAPQPSETEHHPVPPLNGFGASGLTDAEIAAFFAPLPSFLNDRQLSDRTSPAYDALRQRMREEEAAAEIDERDPLDALSKALASRVADLSSDQTVTKSVDVPVSFESHTSTDQATNGISIPPTPTDRGLRVSDWTSSIDRPPLPASIQSNAVAFPSELSTQPGMHSVGDISSSAEDLVSPILPHADAVAPSMSDNDLMAGHDRYDDEEALQADAASQVSHDERKQPAVAAPHVTSDILRGTEPKPTTKQIRFIKAKAATDTHEPSIFRRMTASLAAYSAPGPTLQDGRQPTEPPRSMLFSRHHGQQPSFRWDIFAGGLAVGILLALAPTVYLWRHQATSPEADIAAALPQVSEMRDTSAAVDTPSAVTPSAGVGNKEVAPPASPTPSTTSAETPAITAEQADKLLQSAQSMSTAAGPITGTSPAISATTGQQAGPGAKAVSKVETLKIPAQPVTTSGGVKSAPKPVTTSVAVTSSTNTKPLSSASSKPVTSTHKAVKQKPLAPASTVPNKAQLSAAKR